MKNYILILLITALFSCKANRTSETLDEFPLEVPEENSLMAHWEKKEVLESRLIDDMEIDSGWEVRGIGEKSYTQERAKDGKQSMRFRTSLRDTAFYRLPRNRSEWDSFTGGSGGYSSVFMNFDTPQDWSEFNRVSFWVYVHQTTMPTYTLSLSIENEGTLPYVTKPRRTHYIQDLKPGSWNHVLFEMHHMERDRVISFGIRQELIGHHPEEEGIVTHDIDKLEIQRVIPDHIEGWEVAPGKFSFSHIGYRPKDVKIAMAGNGEGESFELLDQDDNIVFSGNTTIIENKNGKFYQLDFSDFNIEGIYRIRYGSMESTPFPINKNIWIKPVFSALNFFFCQRCGFPVPGVHLECHKDWQGFHGDVKKIINGGWHDAGDLSQGSFRTAMAAFAMMANIELLEKQSGISELTERMRQELAWGLDWLLKTRFGDGYHISFSVMRIYTDNTIGTIDDNLTPARNIPWENFLAAAVQCKAAGILEKSHPELATKSKQAAIEDWQAAMASRKIWDQASYEEASWGVTSSLLIAEMTGDQRYKDHAILFGDLLLQCQEQNFKDGIPITGYFYTRTDRKNVIHNNHAAFEEAAMLALALLCKEFPDHDKWIEWYSATVMHSDFFMKRGSLIAAPYYYLPNSVWSETEIMSESNEVRREGNLRQFNDGTPLNDEYRLRTFPIWRDNLFHGGTNIQLSSAWALAEASRLRKDTEGMILVGKQLQWVMGDNPFGQSLMYGVGYDFAPQFATRLKNLVGSLPVGMDCWSGDKPHWSATNEATFKEIWVEPVSRFLGAVAIYAEYDQDISPKAIENIPEIETNTIQSENGIVDITVTLTGTDNHEIKVLTFNAVSDFSNKQVDLKPGLPVKFSMKLKVTDQNKPYVAVIYSDKNHEFHKEIVGSYVDASILTVN